MYTSFSANYFLTSRPRLSIKKYRLEGIEIPINKDNTDSQPSLMEIAMFDMMVFLFKRALDPVMDLVRVTYALQISYYAGDLGVQ